MSSNLKEVAAALGVSVSTVSRVVNGKSYVKEETRERVLKALEELDYRPNMVARSLKNKNTKTVGVLIPDISEDFFDFVVKGIDSVLRKYHYSMILCDTDENPQTESEYLDLLVEKQIDGIILATVNNDGGAIERFLKSKGIPVVFVDNLPDIPHAYDAVLIDNGRASEVAVRHLASLGHKKIGIITGRVEETTGYERLAGYKKAVELLGLGNRASLIRVGDYKERSGYENMCSLLDENPDMTAVYVSSSKMSYGAIKAIRERGLEIPEDIALVGFDVHDPSGLMFPRITAIMQPEERIGMVAAELMNRCLEEGEEHIHQKIVLDPELVVRGSCGAKTE